MSQKCGALSQEILDEYRRSFAARPELKVSMNAATRGDLPDVALNRQVVQRIDWNFSHEVPVGGITAQRQAGTCWLFASLNWLRKFSMAKMKVEKFEFSQNYMIFWDKLEKANRFLERMIELADRPTDDREVHHYLKEPISDGGDWLLLVDLIEKYGLVPKTAMGETASQLNSVVSVDVTRTKLRQSASRLRALHRQGRSREELGQAKVEIMGEIYRMLCVLYGEPPRRFDLRFRDEKKKFHLDRDLTPRDFYRKWVGLKLRDYLHLVSSPLRDTPYLRTYTFGRSRNIEGVPAAASLNLPVEKLEELAAGMLRRKQAVFFDCDVTHGLNRKLGMLHTELYDWGALFGSDFSFDRAERMEHYHQSPTHCMVLVGVDLVDGKPTKWKIENSWSEENGEKGLFQMNAPWFREYVHGILVPRRLLGRKLEKLWEETSIDVPPWHPMA